MFKELPGRSKIRLFSEYYMNSNYYKEHDVASQVAEERKSNNHTQDQTSFEAVKALTKTDNLLDVIDWYQLKNMIIKF